MPSVAVVISHEFVFRRTVFELIYADADSSRAIVVLILAFICFKLILISSYLVCFKSCKSSKECDGIFGTITADKVLSYDLFSDAWGM